MEKQADTAYPIHELLRRRWSPRAFSDKMVEMDKLQNRTREFRLRERKHVSESWGTLSALATK